jgi:arylsulfatase
MTTGKKPNSLILWGDDIGWWNISYNSRCQMGYRTPNIDRVANEGVAFTDYHGQQSCTAGRAAFITGQNPIRTGLTKVGMPGADLDIRKEDPDYPKAPAFKQRFGPRGVIHGWGDGRESRRWKTPAL